MTQRNLTHAVAPAAPGRWLVLAIVSSALLPVSYTHLTLPTILLV